MLSYIARRLALPETVLARADQRVPTGERDVTALLEDLEARQEALARREREVGERAELLSGKAETIAQREREVKEKERDLERSARLEARRLVLDSRQEIERLKERLQDLPGDWREALLMRAEGELSFKEIAEIQGITEETARWRVFKARQRVNQGSQDTPAKLEKKG